MTTTAGQAADVLLRRLRAYGGTAYTLDEIYDILSKSQRMVNVSLRRITDSATLTTPANKKVYAIRTELTEATDIISVHEGTRLLHPVPTFKEFLAYDRAWWRATGTRFEAWAQVGRDLLFLYPQKTAASSVIVHYAKLLDVLDDANDTFELPDEDLDFLYDLAEAMLLLRQRYIPEAAEKIKQLQESLTEVIQGGR